MSTILNKLKYFFRPTDLTQGSCWKTILSFSFPIIISYLLQQVYSISDAAIVGQTLSASEVAGVNDTSSLVFIFLQFAFGVSAGFCVITSCRVGANDDEGVRKSLATQIELSLVLTAVLTTVALLMLKPMLARISVTPDSPEVYRAAYTYCTVVFGGIGAQLFYNFICSFLRSLGDSVTPLLFLLFSTVLNVGLDLLCIITFGWGVFGAAIATVTAQLVSTVGCFVYAFKKYPKIRPRKEDWKIDIGDALLHAKQGIPLGLQFSVLAIGLIAVQSVVVKFDIIDGVMVSHAAQNGFGAANKLNNLLMTPLNGFGAAMTSFTAQNMGADRPDRVKKGTLQALGIMVIIAAVCVTCGVLLSVDNTYLKIFLSGDKINAETIHYANSYLYIDLSLYVFLGFIFVVRNCVQGIGQPRYILGAGAAELLARMAICLTLPAVIAGGTVSAAAPDMAYYALCFADPAAWIAADMVLAVPFFRNIIKMNYKYFYRIIR